MATITPTTITDTTRASKTINIIINVTPGTGEIIDSVGAIIDTDEPSVLITPGQTSVSIVGSYRDPFKDILTYVEKGSSNVLETPVVVEGIANLPPNKDFYDLKQDQSQQSVRTYTITVNLKSGSPQTFTLTHKILNDLDSMQSFIASYFN